MKKDMMPNVIIFDFDGTTTKGGLMSSMVDFLHAEKGALRAIKIAHQTYEALKKAKKATIPVDLRTGALKRGLVHLCAAPQQDLPDLMALAQAADIRLGLLSNNSRKAWGDRLMRHVNYGLTFDHTMYSEDVGPHVKPNPQGLLRMIDAMVPEADEAKNIWLVGDTKSDMLAAINAMAETPHKITPVALGVNTSAARFIDAYRKTAGAKQAMTCKSIEDLALRIMIAEDSPLLPCEPFSDRDRSIVMHSSQDLPERWYNETYVAGFKFE